MKAIALVPVVIALAQGCDLSNGPEEHNKLVAAGAFEEILSRGNLELASVYYHPDFSNHGLNRDLNLAQDMEAARNWRLAFPDATVEIQKIVAEKDHVAVLWLARGTNTGSGAGLPATGKPVELRGITIWRIVDGRILEEWSTFDQLSILRQLGLLPEN